MAAEREEREEVCNNHSHHSVHSDIHTETEAVTLKRLEIKLQMRHMKLAVKEKDRISFTESVKREGN